MQRLESVGTVIDVDGMTYPMLAGGGYDADEGVHVSDIETGGDWMTNLSDADWSVVDLALILARNLQRIRTCEWCGSRYRADPVEPSRFCSDDCATDSHNLEEAR